MSLIIRDSIPQRKITNHFVEGEMACKCCGKILYHPELMRKLETLRHQIGRPITVTSGYRCESYNNKVGGAPASQHLLGTAADITVRGMTVDVLANHAEKIFDGVGKYPDQKFVHVDVRGFPQRWLIKG